MDVKKAKLYLNKINRLFEGVEQDNGQIARIEKDLMLSYVREFYETFLDDDVPPPAPQKIAPIQKVVIERPPKPQPKVVEPVYVAPKPKPVAPPPPKPVAPQPKPKPEPVVEQPKYVPPPPKPEVQKYVAPKVEVKPEPKYEPIQVPKAQPKTAPETTSSAINFDEFDILFEENLSGVKDLQHKLSQAKVTNLRNAMGINERFLIQNELFGGNNNAFNDAIDKLNTFDNFIQAKAYIIRELASQNNWIDEKRIKRAQSFVRTINRRYK